MVGAGSVSGEPILSSVAAAPPDRAKAILGKRFVSAIVMTTRQAVRGKMSRAAPLTATRWRIPGPRPGSAGIGIEALGAVSGAGRVRARMGLHLCLRRLVSHDEPTRAVLGQRLHQSLEAGIACDQAASA
jgi:hypothetical protein